MPDQRSEKVHPSKGLDKKETKIYHRDISSVRRIFAKHSGYVFQETDQKSVSWPPYGGWSNNKRSTSWPSHLCEGAGLQKSRISREHNLERGTFPNLRGSIKMACLWARLIQVLKTSSDHIGSKTTHWRPNKNITNICHDKIKKP